MTIGNQMREDFDVWKHRHDDLLRWYVELRGLYLAATGVDYQPSDLMSPDVTALTENDQAWLKGMGVTL